jgi:hypothetical protein
MPSSRSSPNSARAKKERAEKFGHFIRTHCVATLPGTHPFFHGLYTALRLQTLPSNLGGAGERLIEWEFDDAVFMESAYVLTTGLYLNLLLRIIVQRERFYARSC